MRDARGAAPPPTIAPGRERSRLSPRERQIALLIAQGLPTKAIAWRLGISVWTVSTYLRRIFARFGVQSRAAMIARLFEHGLL
ncbi:MAG TPA: LuxR C-terminal-related transcriptional regulator [bacterium]|nr:LuxR C-terminal-related transcriptional regulator [bacterium]